MCWNACALSGMMAACRCVVRGEAAATRRTGEREATLRLLIPMLMAKRTGLTTSHDAGGKNDACGDRGVHAACADSLSMILALRRRAPSGYRRRRPRQIPWCRGLSGDGVVQPDGELAKLPSHPWRRIGELLAGCTQVNQAKKCQRYYTGS
jgi:hypothetical protein